MDSSTYSTRLGLLEEKVDLILKLVEAQRPVQQRLDHHITFIESIYDRLKGAINYLSYFSPKALLGSTTPTLTLENPKCEK